MKDSMIVFIGLSIIPGIITSIMIATNTILKGMLFAVLLWVVPIGLALWAYYSEKNDPRLKQLNNTSQRSLT